MRTIHTAIPQPLLDVEVRHLKLVVALAETRSVTRAGQALHLTQSALSHQLNDLESRLNVQLFARTSTGLVPSAAGRQLLKIAYDVLARLNAARTEFASLGSQSSGSLRITTECFTCYRWLPQVLKELSVRFPRVEVVVEVGATRRPLEALAANEVDLALMYSSVKRGAYVARPLFEDEWVAVMSWQHPLAKRPFLRAADFAGETAILYAPLDRHMLVYRKFFHPVKVQPRKVLPAALTEAMIEMAKANLGIAVLTRWSVEPELRAGTVVALPLDRDGLRRTWHAVYRKQKGTSPYLHEFIRLLKTAFPMGPSLAAAASAGA